MEMKVQIIGIPWYKKENFKTLLKIFNDSHKLHDTHHEWLASAEELRQRMEAKGVRVVCADIDPKEFPEWCKSKGRKLDADARGEYASMVAYKVFNAH